MFRKLLSVLFAAVVVLTAAFSPALAASPSPSPALAATPTVRPTRTPWPTPTPLPLDRVDEDYSGFWQHGSPASVTRIVEYRADGWVHDATRERNFATRGEVNNGSNQWVELAIRVAPELVGLELDKFRLEVANAGYVLDSPLPHYQPFTITVNSVVAPPDQHTWSRPDQFYAIAPLATARHSSYYFGGGRLGGETMIIRIQPAGGDVSAPCVRIEWSIDSIRFSLHGRR